MGYTIVMQASGVRRELTDGWELIPAWFSDTPDVDRDDTSGGLSWARAVATHESGAQLLLADVSDYASLPDQWFVGLAHRLESNGWVVTPTTASAFFDDAGAALAYINDMATDVSAGLQSYVGVAVVPHDGSGVLSGDSETILPTPADLQQNPPFADVFAVNTQALEDSVDMNALESVRNDLVTYVLGDQSEPPDVFRELASKQEAYAETALHVFTVSQPTDIEPASEFNE